MRPNEILKVLDLARKVTKMGNVFNPLFVGPPGVGKSEIVQQWCRSNGLPFIDLRAAYLEAPDLIGFPAIEIVKGRQITRHYPPEFLPSHGEGVLLLEEPNRGTTSVMNTFMQLLTDRKVHTYELPPGWIIVGCINPETELFDVNTMDPALKNRFEIFTVDYDKRSFIDFMKTKDWDDSIVNFVESNTFSYLTPDKVSGNNGSKYISPRSFAKLNSVIKAGLDSENEITIYESILGTNYAKSFFAFRHHDQPVLYKDLLEDTNKALRRLQKLSDPADCKNGHLSITIKDIVEKAEIEDELLSKVLMVLPTDLAPVLIRELEANKSDDTLFHRIMTKYPEVGTRLKKSLKTK